jgi:carboxyl-terminal processing protease
MKRPWKLSCALLATLALGAVALADSGNPSPAERAATEANITRLTTALLEHSQFSHHPLDAELAGKLFDRYLDALDGTRSLLLKTDVDELSSYRANLAQATRATGDTRAAYAVFDRYMQRLEQQVAYDTELLRSEKFEFTGHDSFSLDREHAARPADLNAAHELWRQEVRSEYLQEKLGDKKADEIVKTLTRRYAQQLKTMKALDRDEVLEVYLNALAHVYDPHSDYLGHEQMESLSIAMNLSLFGIGAALNTEDGYCTIQELVPGGPAAKSGLLKPGDRIVAVAQGGKEPTDVTNMPLTRIVELIRGPKGSAVTLTILPAAGGVSAVPKTVPLIRDEIKLQDQEAKARIVDLPAPAEAKTTRVGVIDLTSFYSDNGGGHGGATADVARLLKKLKEEQVQGVVLDLRRNGGGSLQEAITLTGLFIRRGPVVQTKNPDGAVEVETDRDPSVAYDGPLLVLTSRFSASASEIVAGALQDYGRAVVVGDSSTFGKGTVQTVVPLARVMDQNHIHYAFDPGALKVTISKFYRPSGSSTELKGVASDIVLPSLSDVADVGESKLNDPLPWDTVPPSQFDKLDEVQPYLAALRERSAKRVKAEKAFTFLRQDVAELKQRLASRAVSLNEAERRRELAENKTRQKELDAEAKQLRASAPAMYEITVKNAGQPGLPPRMAFTETASVSSPHGKRSARNDESGAAEDIILNEALDILGDYVHLLGAKK